MNKGLAITVLLFVLLIFSASLFIERPVKNVLLYGHWHPNCEEFISTDRCLKNYTWERNIRFKAVKADDFAPLSPPHYFLGLWIPGMMNTLSTPVYNRPPTLGMEIMGAAGVFLVISFILIDLKYIWADKRLRLLFIVGALYCLSLLLANYRGYVSLGQPIAIAGRYFLPVAPILLFLALRPIVENARRWQWFGFTVITLCILALTQGAGITSFILKSDTSHRIDVDGIPTQINNRTKSLLEDISVDKSGFRRI